MNYTHEDIPFTRIVEHKHFEFGQQAMSIISKEYPAEWGTGKGKTPYYPINDERNSELYRKYRAEADRHPDIVFGGRLAEYRYYDMHQVIGAALSSSRNALNPSLKTAGDI